MNSAAPRLNIFQRVIRQWERLHPYNAAQAMRLRRRFSVDEITRAWRSTLIDLGLGPIHFDDDRVMYELSRSAVAGSSPLLMQEDDCLESFLSRHLNQPWEEDTLPFRPFLKPENGQEQIVGVIYRHCASDSYSIRLILREWLARLHAPDTARKAPLLPARRGYWHHYGPFAADWSLIGAMLRQMNALVRMRKCRRVIPPPPGAVVEVRFREYRAPDGLNEALRKSARARGAKVNDLFLAAMFRAAAVGVPLEPTKRRRDMVIGTIVDLRGQAGRSPGDAFGLFLGFTSTFARGAMLRDRERLVAGIAGQSRRLREAQIPQASQLALTTGLLAALCLEDEELQEFYRRRFPLMGGISNVNLRGTWAERLHPDLLGEYVRVSPTGPFMPLVVTPTSLGPRLHIGVTTRTSAIDSTKADLIARQFLAELSNLV